MSSLIVTLLRSLVKSSTSLVRIRVGFFGVSYYPLMSRKNELERNGVDTHQSSFDGFRTGEGTVYFLP